MEPIQISLALMALSLVMQTITHLAHTWLLKQYYGSGRKAEELNEEYLEMRLANDAEAHRQSTERHLKEMEDLETKVKYREAELAYAQEVLAGSTKATK